MPWWFGNNLFVAGILIATWVGGLILFRNFDSHKVGDWRFINYAIVILGAFGLWGLLIESSTETARRRLEIERPQYEETLQSLKSHFRFYRTYHCERTFSRTEFSPPDFDDVARAQKTWCDWLNSASKIVENLTTRLCQAGFAQALFPLAQIRAIGRSSNPHEITSSLSTLGLK